MATLTADRHFVQHSLLDPHEEERDLRTSPPRIATPAPAPAPEARAERVPTLDDLVSGTWTELLSSHAATCFVCGGQLAPRWSSGPRPVGGKCRDCGSELA